MQFPLNVYHSPGTHQAPNGKSFSLLSVDDEIGYNAAIKAGWWPSVPEAIEHSGNALADLVFEEDLPAPAPAPAPAPKAKAKAKV